MSANTSIKEGGKGRAFGPVTALMVQGDDGKYLPWVPESERQLGTKSVNKNGVYQAKKDGVYGWRSVSVNVPTDQGVTGTDPTTGQQVAVGVGPTGELTETVVPVEIRVETPPTFTGPYRDRAYISFDGLTVAAYGEDGNKMQDVPFNELIFPVTVTDASAVVAGKGIRTLNGKSVEVSRSIFTLQNWYSGSQQGWIKNMSSTNSCGSGVLIVNDNGYYTAVSDNYDASIHYAYGSDGAYMYMEDKRGAAGFNATTSEIGISDVTHKMMYQGVVEGANRSGSGAWQLFNTPELQASGYDLRTTADIALHGAGELGGGQYVPVLWPRPGDGAVLETGFYIDVVDVSPNNNDGN